MDFKDIPEVSYIKEAVYATLKSNGMNKDTHIRLTLSRGRKITSGMNPALNQFELYEFEPDDLTWIDNYQGENFNSKSRSYIQNKYSKLGALTGVPTFIVNDKYKININTIKNQQELDELIAFLLAL